MRKLALAAALSTMAATMGLAHADDALTPSRTIKIGVLSDYASQFSFYTGKYTLQAVNMAVEDFLAQKPGRKVQVVFADHQNKPDVGSGISRNWFDNEGVDIIADLPSSPVTLAVLPIATERKKILLASSTSNTMVTNELCNGMLAQWAYNSHTLNASVPALLAQGGQSWFFVSWDNATGKDSESDATAMIQAGGGRVLGSVRHPLGVPDVSSYILQAQQSGAQVIAFANAGGDFVKSVKASAEFGVMQKQKLVGLIMSLPDVHGLGLQTAQGLYYADGFYWDRNEETRAFARRFFAANGQSKMPDNVAAANYSATLHYLRAADAAGTVEAQAVMAKMRETRVDDFYSRGGQLREDGQMVHDVYLLQVKTPAESKEAWDYLRVIATVPGAQAYAPLSESRCKLVRK